MQKWSNLLNKNELWSLYNIFFVCVSETKHAMHVLKVKYIFLHVHILLLKLCQLLKLILFKYFFFYFTHSLSHTCPSDGQQVNLTGHLLIASMLVLCCILVIVNIAKLKSCHLILLTYNTSFLKDTYQFFFSHLYLFISLKNWHRVIKFANKS